MKYHGSHVKIPRSDLRDRNGRRHVGFGPRAQDNHTLAIALLSNELENGCESAISDLFFSISGWKG